NPLSKNNKKGDRSRLLGSSTHLNLFGDVSDQVQYFVRVASFVATNLSTGRELWLTEGDIHLAVRASCSMPGLMAPVPHNGYWL
ncbi:hypothetical protein QUG45_26020, partial [Enterobacter hormaechei]|uniref:patatin-like phospholipase family protein n=1 Tax=Enterobacter hormaechei TaxID=158836 RepID=UPI003342345A|nr:hypothetical protein [Enterobacter hormaechei]